MSNKTFKEFAEACWVGYKKVGMKKSSRTGKQVPNCVPEELEDDSPDVVQAVKNANAMAEKRKLKEVSSAMRALRRRNAKNARTQKTIAKYGQAAKMGIPADQVNQRRTAVTRKKI